MRVLTVHNFYQSPGGEDEVFRTEAGLLESFGHFVRRLEFRNEELGLAGKVAVGLRAVWNRDAAQKIDTEVRAHQIEIVHFHNTFPLISPAGLRAAARAGAAVVQTVHNYRFVCANGLFFRDGHPCEDCAGRIPPWPAVLHGCYRTRGASAAYAAMRTVHRIARTDPSSVDLYIAPSQFVRRKLVENGTEPSKIEVHAHLVEKAPLACEAESQLLLYVGRLSEEKGVAFILRSLDMVNPSIRLRLVGDGPLRGLVAASAKARPGIEWMGPLPRDEARLQMQQAAALVAPSTCYETFGLSAAEARACGLPVICPRGGALAEQVRDEEDGLLFRSGDARSLSTQILRLFREPGLRERLLNGARRARERLPSRKDHCDRLLELYRRAQASRRPTEAH